MTGASDKSAGKGSATAATNSEKKANGQYTVVLTCPAEARVTIGGRITYASGTHRQYQLEFAGETHNCRLEMQFHDNDEQATYTFDHDIGCQNGKQLALSVSRRQMTKVPDKPWTDEVAKHLNSTNVIFTADNGKVEVKSRDEFAKEFTRLSALKLAEEIAAPPTNVQPQIAQQTKRLSGWTSAREKLNPELTTKTKHLEAVVKIRQQTQDALLLKQDEVNAAINNAPVLEVRRHDAKKLELELNRAREQENEARSSLQQTLNDANGLDGNIKKAREALAQLWLLEAVEKQTQIKDSADAEIQRLDEEIGATKLRVNALNEALRHAAAKLDAGQQAVLQALLTAAKSEYDAAQQQRSLAWRKSQRELKTLDQIRAGSPPDKRP